MQRAFTFECSSYLMKLKDPQISKINGEDYIWQQYNEDTTEDDCFYDGFDYEDLIPEFMKLAKKENGKNQNKLAKEWAKKWGLLEVEQIGENIYGQKISSFWQEAHSFTGAIRYYEMITNRQYKTLKFFLTFFAEDDFTQYSDDKLSNYQWNGMKQFTNDIEKRIGRARLQVGEIKRIRHEDNDQFTIKPVYHFDNLIDVIYMQLFIAFTENMKVCPVCNKPFSPERKDKLYCSDACKSTAKSQRYRARKASI